MESQALSEQKAKQKPLRVVISGAPASGKGTQCEYIVAKVCLRFWLCFTIIITAAYVCAYMWQYGLLHISTGDLLRAEVAAATENGLRAKDYMTKGQLVPDEIVTQVMCCFW